MDMKTAIDASRARVPVTYNGIKYMRITARITRITARGGESFSLELLDYNGSTVVTAPVNDVELAEGDV